MNETAIYSVSRILDTGVNRDWRNGVQQVSHMTFFSNGMCTETLPILCSLEQ